MPTVPTITAAGLGRALARTDPRLAADARRNLAELQSLVPRVAGCLRRIHDHAARLDEALAAAGVLDLPLADETFAGMAVSAALDEAWRLADAVLLAHPDRL